MNPSALVTLPLPVGPVAVTLSLGDASVNVIWAWETEPTAVRVIFMFASAASVLNELLEIFPLASAVVGVVRVIGLSLSRSGTSTRVSVTVSLGCQPSR